MSNPIVVDVRNVESAVPRIEAYAANVRKECNHDDKTGRRPCGFEFVGVSLSEYRKNGTFDIDYQCSRCNFAQTKTVIVNMYDETLGRGNSNVTP